MMLYPKPAALWMRALALFGLSLTAAGADERMNAMVGLWYGPYNGYSFEYDLIAQVWKSKDWKGNITGPFIMEEVSTKSNRLGLGVVTGSRLEEKGTFAISLSVFAENRWSRFSRTRMGAEGRISLFIFGLKAGMIDRDRMYWQAGLSY